MQWSITGVKLAAKQHLQLHIIKVQWVYVLDVGSYFGLGSCKINQVNMWVRLQTDQSANLSIWQKKNPKEKKKKGLLKETDLLFWRFEVKPGFFWSVWPHRSTYSRFAQWDFKPKNRQSPTLTISQDEKTKSGAWSFSSGQVRAKSHRAALGEAVLRVAHFDSAPVARPYQADETQQVGESPGHIGGIVSTGKVPSTNS